MHDSDIEARLREGETALSISKGVHAANLDIAIEANAFDPASVQRYDLLRVTTDANPALAFLLTNDCTPVVTVASDGNVTLGPGVTLDDASRAFWDEVSRYGKVMEAARKAALVEKVKALQSYSWDDGGMTEESDARYVEIDDVIAALEGE